MQAMRERLLNQVDPVTTLARLQAAELQLRELQATLIAERVARPLRIERKTWQTIATSFQKPSVPFDGLETKEQ
jgi:hypothetical protein